MKIVVLAKVEMDASEPMAYPPDYVERLLNSENWNDVSVDPDIWDDLRTAFIETITLEHIEIVSVKKV